jgi:hypothetical protein
MVTCPEIRSMEVSHLGRAWSGTLQRSAPGRAERDETCVEQRRTAADVQALAPGDNDHRAPHRGWRDPVSATRHERGLHLRPKHAEGIGAPAGDHGVVPGGAERTEERHVGFIEALGAAELPASANGMDSSPSLRSSEREL